jgi:hypothetical protein
MPVLLTPLKCSISMAVVRTAAVMGVVVVPFRASVVLVVRKVTGHFVPRAAGTTIRRRIVIIPDNSILHMVLTIVAGGTTMPQRSITQWATCVPSCATQNSMQLTVLRCVRQQMQRVQDRCCCANRGSEIGYSQQVSQAFLYPTGLVW